MSYYKTLGVNENATAEEIKNSYRALAKKYHPDVYQGNARIAENVMSEINEAYAVLSDEQSRQRYDASLGIGAKADAAKKGKREHGAIEIFAVLVLITIAVLCAVYIVSALNP